MADKKGTGRVILATNGQFSGNSGRVDARLTFTDPKRMSKDGKK